MCRPYFKSDPVPLLYANLLFLTALKLAFPLFLIAPELYIGYIYDGFDKFLFGVIFLVRDTAVVYAHCLALTGVFSARPEFGIELAGVTSYFESSLSLKSKENLIGFFSGDFYTLEGFPLKTRDLMLL